MQLRKVVTLTHKFESFTMMDGEIVDDMLRRMHILLNYLEALRQSFLRAQKNPKLLDNMPKVWDSKVMPIAEARDFMQGLFESA